MKLPPRKRILLALLASAALVFTLVIVAPFELVAGNSSSLIFGLLDVWKFFVLPALLICAVMTAILCVLPERFFNAGVMLVFGLALASYIQALVLNGTLPTADGRDVVWEDYTKITCVTFVIWTIIVVLPLEISRFKRNIAQTGVLAISAILIFVQAIGVGSLFVGAIQAKAESASYTVTEEGLYTVSANDNVIVFVLDMYDNTNDLMPLVESNPELLSEMTGFTWFQNCTAVITPTRDAIPAMLTGETLTHEQTFADYAASRYDNATYLTDLKNAGYNIGLYSDAFSTSKAYIQDNADNVVPSSEVDLSKSLNGATIVKELVQCGLFRDLPWCFKPFFWFYTDDINQAAQGTAGTFNTASYDAENTMYTISDPDYAKKLNSLGLTIDENALGGAFRFIHLNGAHYPYTMDENEGAGSGFSREQQCTGVMNVVSDYLRQLKELGLYDDATIIITSDHGYYESHDAYETTDIAINPILLVKPAESASEASQPIAISDKPVCNIDAMPTALAHIASVRLADDDVNALTDDTTGRKRIFRLIQASNVSEYGLIEYEIDGDANDLANWSTTGWYMNYPDGTWEQIGEPAALE